MCRFGPRSAMACMCQLCCIDDLARVQHTAERPAIPPPTMTTLKTAVLGAIVLWSTGHCKMCRERIPRALWQDQVRILFKIRRTIVNVRQFGGCKMLPKIGHISTAFLTHGDHPLIAGRPFAGDPLGPHACYYNAETVQGYFFSVESEPN